MDPQLQHVIYRHSPERLTQGWEAAFMRDYFLDREGGLFVDVGANHHQVRNTTHYLDKALGWQGIAIDPIAEFAAGYAEHRPRTKYLQLFVGKRSDEDVDFFVVIEDHEPVSEEIHAYFEKHGYALIESYTAWDGRNAYFVPSEDLKAFLERETLDARWGVEHAVAERSEPPVVQLAERNLETGR